MSSKRRESDPYTRGLTGQHLLIFLLFEKPCVGLPKGLEKQEREATDVYSMAAVLLVEPSDPLAASKGSF